MRGWQEGIAASFIPHPNGPTLSHDTPGGCSRGRERGRHGQGAAAQPPGLEVLGVGQLPLSSLQSSAEASVAAFLCEIYSSAG